MDDIRANICITYGKYTSYVSCVRLKISVEEGIKVVKCGKAYFECMLRRLDLKMLTIRQIHARESKIVV